GQRVGHGCGTQRVGQPGRLDVVGDDSYRGESVAPDQHVKHVFEHYARQGAPFVERQHRLQTLLGLAETLDRNDGGNTLHEPSLGYRPAAMWLLVEAS